MDDRKGFLIEIYKQMFADINRHMTVVWQSVSVVVGAFAIFALVEKNVLPIDIAVSLIVILCAWLYAHMLDAAYWYNRNLAIIANVEKLFLLPSDLRDVHYYFGAHRSRRNRMITQLRIQSALGIAIGVLVLLFHFSERVWPGRELPFSNLQPTRLLPYLTAAGALWFCTSLTKDRRKAYGNFLINSPGVDVPTEGIIYGTGHRVDPK